MEELRTILIAHANRYPLMQPTDAVKLIYQNEFGGGHLIRDEQACLNYLKRGKEMGENPALHGHTHTHGQGGSHWVVFGHTEKTHLPLQVGFLSLS